MKNPYVRRQSSQRGAVTLIVTLLIMIALTIGSFGMIQTSMVEARMTANDQRSREAFQAAQSGIDFVLAALATTPVDRGLVCAPATWDSYDFELNFQGPVLVEDPDDGSVRVDFSFDSTAQEAACNSIPFGIITRMQVWSRGYSEDGSSVRTLASTIDLSAPWSFIPPLPSGDDLAGGTPVVARRDGQFAGQGEAARCTTEPGPYNCGDLYRSGNVSGLIDGDTVTLGGRVTKEAGNYPHKDAIDSENSEVFSKSPDEFFEEYMGGERSDFTDEENWGEDGGVCKFGPNNDCVGARQIYVPEGVKLNGNVAYGEFGDGRGVRMYVEGDLDIAGTAKIIGVVYVAGGWGAGTAKIFGQLLAENDVDMTGNIAVYGNRDLVPGPAEDPPPPEALAQFSEARKSFLRLGSWREVRSGS